MGYKLILNKMQVENNSKVTIEYEGKFEDGTVFDSTKKDNGQPLVFVVGSGQVIPGFEKGIIGMNENEEKEIEVEAKDGYGEYREELKKEIPKETLKLDKEVEKGMMLMLGTEDGRKFPARVVDVKDDKITLDLNHPLAGKKLIFKIKVVKIENSNQNQV